MTNPQSERIKRYQEFVKKCLEEHKKFKANLREIRKYGFETLCIHGAFTKQAAHDAKSIIPCASFSSSSN